MSLNILEAANDARRALAVFSEAKRIFDELARAKVQISDGKTLAAVDEAKKLIKLAGNNHQTISMFVDELVHPATAATEYDRLLKMIDDHSSELSKFLADAKALVGAEFEVITKLIAEGEAQKLQALAGK